MRTLNRRSFLLESFCVAGGVALHRDIFRGLQTWHENNEGIFVPPELAEGSEVETLSVYCDGDGYLLAFGPKELQPQDAPDRPTWREYLEEQSVDASDPAAVRTWVEDNYGGEPGDDPHPALTHPGKLVDEDTYSDFVDAWCITDSPTASAYHYLQSLDLANTPARGGKPWPGELRFGGGSCIGSNYLGVTADSLETCSALQQRLVELGQRVRLEYPQAWE